MTVGERLKRMRQERGMTQSDLGRILGMTKGAIQKYESGQLRNFKADTVKILTEYFGVPPVFFIYDEIPTMDELNSKELVQAVVGDQFASFLEDLEALNEEGARKVMEYCSDLALVDKYRKDEGRTLKP